MKGGVTRLTIPVQLLSALLVSPVVGCAPSAKVSESSSVQIHPSRPTSCGDALVYETSDAHPDIRWVKAAAGGSSNSALSCLLGGDNDDGSIEMKAYMSSGLYQFVRECRADAGTVHRLFRHKRHGRPYALRLHKDAHFDPTTWIIVSSYRKPAGNFQHEIGQRGNRGADVSLCPAVTEQ